MNKYEFAGNITILSALFIISIIITIFCGINENKIKQIEETIQTEKTETEQADLKILEINSAVMVEFATTYPNRTLVAIDTKETEYSFGVYISNVYSNYENEFKQNNYVSAFYGEEIKIYEVR